MIKGDEELQAASTEPGVCSGNVSSLCASSPQSLQQLQSPAQIIITAIVTLVEITPDPFSVLATYQARCQVHPRHSYI